LDLAFYLHNYGSPSEEEEQEE